MAIFCVIETINCTYTNADCLTNKVSELRLLIRKHKPTIVGITEVKPHGYILRHGLHLTVSVNIRYFHRFHYYSYQYNQQGARLLPQI
jgi:hypothetical protein